MIGLILTLIVAAAIAYFTKNGTSNITVSLGADNHFTVPLFIVTVGTFLLGIVFAWIIEVPQSILTKLHIIGLGSRLKSGKSTIEQLENKITKLELENSRLNDRLDNRNAYAKTQDSDKPRSIRSFIDRISNK